MSRTKTLLPLAALLALIVPASASAAAKPKFRFAATTYAVAENSASLPVTAQNPEQGFGVLTVTRQRRGGKAGSTTAQSILYSTSNGTATAGSDYTATSGQLDFPACGVGSPASTDPCVQQKIRVPITDDSLVEGVETVSVDLRPIGTNTAIVNPSHAVLSIVDNDTGSGGSSDRFQLAAASEDVSEGNGTETVYILRNGDFSSAASVDYATADGSATVVDGDYVAKTGTASFAAGEIFQAVNVAITDDSIVESTESLSLVLSNPSTGYALGTPSTQTINIVDNDSPAAFEFSEAGYTVAENGTELLVTVRATGALGNNGMTVQYATTDGTAVAGSDYTAAGGELLFDSGDVSQTIAVPITDDTADEADESFGLSLTDATPTNWDSATVSILDNDTAPAANGDGGSTGGTTVVNETNTTNVTNNTTQGDGQIVLGARQAACGLTAFFKRTQKVLKQKALRIGVQTLEACKVTVSATVKQVKAAKKPAKSARALKFKGKSVSTTLQAKKAKILKVKFTKRTLKAIKKALKARKKLVATVVITTRDSASKVNRKTLKITIK